MRWLRFIPFLLLVAVGGSALLLSGALAQQTTPPAQPSQTSRPAAPPPDAKAAPAIPEPKADPKATELVNKAIAGLSPDKLGWIETAISQQVNTQGFSFQAAGRYVSGPDYRLRVELKLKVGGTQSESLAICDGTTVWNAVRVGEEPTAVSRWDLKKVQQMLNSPTMRPQLRSNFYRQYLFMGLVPLVQNVATQMVFTRTEPARVQNREATRVTAEWKADLASQLAKQSPPWPVYIPRTCYLYLSTQTPVWPYRMEWWGPTTPNGPDSLLVGIEYKNPQRINPDPNLFQYNPGKTQVIDNTQRITESLTAAASAPEPGKK
jgi:hypothetical protein